VWHEVRTVYKKNKEDFLKYGLKSDWFGRIYKVINRDVKVELGSPEDEMILRDELTEIQNILVKHNIIDLLAYSLNPLEEDDGKTFEHGYLIVFTPAYILEKQYLTFKNVLLLLLAFLSICFLGGLLWG